MDGAFWQRYERVEAKTYKTFEVKDKVFGVDPKNRRLGGVETPRPTQPKHTIKIKSQELEDKLPMEDQAVLQTGKALMLSERSSKDDFIKAVQVAYSAGKGALSETQRNAVALVAWSMGLDPSPGVGHLYAWSDNQGFHIFIGYQGWITKARQSGHEFIYNTRVMTPDERLAHGLNDSQIGAICELYDMKSAEMWKRIGIAPKPLVGSSVVNAGESTPRGRTRLWLAEKRAIVDAIKKMGVSFGAYTIQPIEGMQWSVSGGEYIASEGALAPTPEQVIEGVYEDIEAPIASADDTRPYSPEALMDDLRSEAESTRATPPVVIDATQLKHFHTALSKLSKVDTEKKAFIKAVFGRDSSKALEVCEYEAIVNWISADEELARQEWNAWVGTLAVQA